MMKTAIRSGQGRETAWAGVRRPAVWRAGAACCAWVTTAVLGWVLLAHGEGNATFGQRGIKAMTINLYVGGGIGRVAALDPGDPAYPEHLVGTVTGVYYEIVRSEPAIRLQGVADAVAAQGAEVVAVQEASLIRNQ